MFPHMLKVELSSPGSGESSYHVDEVSTLSDGIHHNHHGIVTSRFRQLNNEVCTYSVPWHQELEGDGVCWSASTCHR